MMTRSVVVVSRLSNDEVTVIERGSLTVVVLAGSKFLILGVLELGDFGLELMASLSSKMIVDKPD